MGWDAASPWKIISGSGQSLALTASTPTHFANTVGSSSANSITQACAISLAPAATAYGALIRITGSAAAASASLDFFVKSTDPPFVFGCSEGDTVNVYPTANGTAYLCELTH